MTPTEALAAALAPHLRLRLNRNRRTLVSLRLGRHGHGVVSVHPDVLADPAALPAIVAWATAGGRAHGAALNRIIRDVAARQAAALPAPDLPVIGAGFDLAACYARVHATWFHQLDRPTLRLGRNRRGRLSHIRFGCYYALPAPRITLHPRLLRPWVALAFVEHVCFHELVHHAQRHAQRGRGHGPWFRARERAFPGHGDALAWERARLHDLLAGDSVETGAAALASPALRMHSPPQSQEAAC